MAEFDVKTGHDTWLTQAQPTVNNATGRYPRVRTGAAAFRTLVFMPLAPAQIAGKTVLSATLSAPAQGNWVSQTLTVQALAANWNVAQVNWNNQPGVTGATATEATGALAAAARFEVDVTALVQAIADGQANYGWRITTSQSTAISTLRGFDSGLASWVLSVETSDVLAEPSQLSPEGVIGVAKPVLSFDDVDDMSQAQVQIDAAANPLSVDFDSGWVSVTSPTLALASTAYAGLADGATTFWRARTKTTNASVSSWSPWVEITRHDKPAIVMDNPAGTDLWDPTPTIAAHLSPAGDAETRWQVIVTGATDLTDQRYNSGDAIEGAALDHMIPLKWRGRTVFPIDGPYRLVVKAWDRSDRVPSAGDPPFVQTVVIVDQDVDGTVTVPTGVTASMDTVGYPDVLVHFERGSDPDRFVILRDGLTLATVIPDDVRVSPGVFEWLDTTAEPNIEHTYRVQAITDVGGVPKKSAQSAAAVVNAVVHGVWLRAANGIDVELFGDGMEVQRVDKRQTFELPYRAENVDIVTSPGVLSGTYAGVIDRRCDDLAATRAQLDAWAQRPQIRVNLVWGTHNIEASVKNLSVTMSQTSLLPSNPIYDVRFTFSELEPQD